MDGLRWLFSLTNYEKGMPAKYGVREFSLGRYQSLLKSIGSPHLCGIPTVQILGTDGKGSTLAFLESLLLLSGKKVCSFISPHLVDVTERFRIDQQSISKHQLNQCLERVRSSACHIEELTFFEVLNAAFWLWVLEINPDLVLLETGLGGRLDTTTICQPTLKILTLLDRDHVPLLGKTVRQIALEKLKALPGGVPAIISRQSIWLTPFITEYLEGASIPALWTTRELESIVTGRTRAGWDIHIKDRKGSSFSFSSKLLGDHQVANLEAALLALPVLGVDLPHTSEQILLEANWQGRCQLLDSEEGGLWILDGSHTPLAGQALRGVLDQILPGWTPREFFVTCSQDRFPWCYLRGLVREDLDQVSLVQTGHPRLWQAQHLVEALHRTGWREQGLPPLGVKNVDGIFGNPPGAGESRIICGSLYWVGHALGILKPAVLE